MKLIPVIMSGGVGSRLWPESREAHPKPFMQLPDGDNLIRKTYRRAAAFDNVSEVMTVTNRDLLFKTVDEYILANAGAITHSFIFHRKVKTTGFQPVSFSATMRGWRASAWITDTAVIRSTRSSITLFG